MAVAGINSRRGGRRRRRSTSTSTRSATTTTRSRTTRTRADGGAYDADDTYGRPARAPARRLGEQLAAMHARQPGREVDLIAHSQGGVVVDVFLQHVYDAADPTYPPLGTVVTLSSPHEGAPLATVAGDVRASPHRPGASSTRSTELLPVPPSDGGAVAAARRGLGAHARPVGRPPARARRLHHDRRRRRRRRARHADRRARRDRGRRRRRRSPTTTPASRPIPTRAASRARPRSKGDHRRASASSRGCAARSTPSSSPALEHTVGRRRPGRAVSARRRLAGDRGSRARTVAVAAVVLGPALVGLVGRLRRRRPRRDAASVAALALEPPLGHAGHRVAVGARCRRARRGRDRRRRRGRAPSTPTGAHRWRVDVAGAGLQPPALDRGTRRSSATGARVVALDRRRRRDALGRRPVADGRVAGPVALAGATRARAAPRRARSSRSTPAPATIRWSVAFAGAIRVGARGRPRRRRRSSRPGTAATSPRLRVLDLAHRRRALGGAARRAFAARPSCRDGLVVVGRGRRRVSRPGRRPSTSPTGAEALVGRRARRRSSRASRPAPPAATVAVVDHFGDRHACVDLAHRRAPVRGPSSATPVLDTTVLVHGRTTIVLTTHAASSWSLDRPSGRVRRRADPAAARPRSPPPAPTRAGGRS